MGGGKSDTDSDDVVGAEEQVVDGDVLLDGIRRAVDAADLVAGEVDDGFAEGLAGDGAGVDACAADGGAAFGDGDAFVQAAGLDGGADAAGAGTNHEEVIVEGGHGVCFHAGAIGRKLT